MSVKHEKNKLKKTIYSGFSDLSKDDIKNLIKKEVEKGPDAANVDYIDFCFELLKSKDVAGNEYKKHNFKPRKALLIAAIVAIAMISALTVSATVFNFNIHQKIAEIVNGDVLVDLNLELADTSADGYALTDTDLFKELAAHGMTPVTLPEYLTDRSCTITEISYDGDYILSATIHFEYNGYSGFVYIDQFFEEIEFVGEGGPMNVKSGQIVRVNGLDVVVIEQEDGSYFRYRDNLTDYTFYLDCNLDMTLELIKSIK